jgi:hypothetical protein
MQLRTMITRAMMRFIEDFCDVSKLGTSKWNKKSILMIRAVQNLSTRQFREKGNGSSLSGITCAERRRSECSRRAFP